MTQGTSRQYRTSRKKPAKAESQKDVRLWKKGIKIGINLGCGFAVFLFLLKGDIETRIIELSSLWINLSHKAGFSVQTVEIEGQRYIHKDDVITLLENPMGKPIFSLNPEEMRLKLHKIGWLKTAMVQRRLPNKLYIRLVEYQPLAFWQKNSKLHLIDQQGKILNLKKLPNLSHLPILTGEGAPAKAPSLIFELAKYPDFLPRVTGAIFLGNRRWDLVIDNKIKVKLPEERWEEAITYLVELNNQHPLKERDIVTLDIRLNDRVFFYLSPETKIKKNHTVHGKAA